MKAEFYQGKSGEEAVFVETELAAETEQSALEEIGRDYPDVYPSTIKLS